MQTEGFGGATSIVSQNVHIDGDIRGDENIQIHGNLKGTIKVVGDIIVGVTGVVEAEVEGLNVVIQGTVVGNVTAKDHLEIQSTGRMIGDITARSIDIKEGSAFEGRSQMIKSAAQKPAASVEPVEKKDEKAVSEGRES